MTTERPKLRGVAGVDLPDPDDVDAVRLVEDLPADEPLQVGAAAWFATAWVGLGLGVLGVAALWVLAVAAMTR